MAQRFCCNAPRPLVYRMSEFSSRDVRIQFRWDWLVVSYILHFAAFVLILYIWNVDGGKVTESGTDNLALTMTAIEIMLAILAIFLGVIAFSGFWMIRREAVSAAEDAAVREVRRLEEEGYLAKKQKQPKDIVDGASPDLSTSVKEDETENDPAQ